MFRPCNETIYETLVVKPVLPPILTFGLTKMGSECRKSCSTDFSEEDWEHIVHPGRYCWSKGVHTYSWICKHYYNIMVNNASLLYILIVLVTSCFSGLFYPILVPCPGGLYARYSCKLWSAIEKTMIKPWDLNSLLFSFLSPPAPVSEIGFRMQLVRFLSGIADADTTNIFCICITWLWNSDDLF